MNLTFFYDLFLSPLPFTPRYTGLLAIPPTLKGSERAGKIPAPHATTRNHHEETYPNFDAASRICFFLPPLMLVLKVTLSARCRQPNCTDDACLLDLVHLTGITRPWPFIETLRNRLREAGSRDRNHATTLKCAEGTPDHALATGRFIQDRLTGDTSIQTQRQKPNQLQRRFWDRWHDSSQSRFL